VFHSTEARFINDLHHNIGGAMGQIATNLLTRVGLALLLGKLDPTLQSPCHGSLIILRVFIDMLLVGGNVAVWALVNLALFHCCPRVCCKAKLPDLPAGTAC
jgi:hypothetical protein